MVAPLLDASEPRQTRELLLVLSAEPWLMMERDIQKAQSVEHVPAARRPRDMARVAVVYDRPHSRDLESTPTPLVSAPARHNLYLSMPACPSPPPAASYWDAHAV